MKDLLEVRDINPETDSFFIYSSWIKNYKNSSYFAKRIKTKIFCDGCHNVITHILAKSGVKVFVACTKEDHDTIIGYLVCEPAKNKAHYFYVKAAFRGMGVAKTLLNAARLNLNGLVFTHWTFPVDGIFNKNPEMIYDPYAL